MVVTLPQGLANVFRSRWMLLWKRNDVYNDLGIDSADMISVKDAMARRLGPTFVSEALGSVVEKHELDSALQAHADRLDGQTESEENETPFISHFSSAHGVRFHVKTEFSPFHTIVHFAAQR